MSDIKMQKSKISLSGCVPTTKQADTSEKHKEVIVDNIKRVATNRSVTCSETLRNRLKVMAAKTGTPMQKILENWMEEGLNKAGF